MENVIELRNIYKKFDLYIDKRQSFKEKLLFHPANNHTECVVLDGVSLSVKKGEAVGLIGRNGCGKSTLLKLISKIMYPEKGAVEVHGRVSSLIELGAGFHPDMSGRENIFINASILGLSKKQTEERMAQIIEFSELGDFIDNPIRTYSSGMYMRLAFAVAINVDADILLIDEILAVGDISFQKKCFDKLKEIKSKGTTIVIVSHSLGQIEKICNKSYWLEGGKIICEGTPKAVHKRYLAYMNQSEEPTEEDLDTLLEKEEQKANEASVTSEQDKVNSEESKAEETVEQPKEEPVEEIKEEFLIETEELKKNAKRWGSREVEIEKVELFDDSGAIKENFKTGEDITIKIQYNAKKRIKNIVAGIGIFRADGINCFGTNTLIDKLKGPTVYKTGEIICKFKNNLLEGNYLLDIALHEPDGYAYDYYREVCKFNVQDDLVEAGIVRLEHTWKY